MYEINPEHNQGLDFQYDEVVRDKEKRKRMHAGDCECCREVRDTPPKATPSLLCAFSLTCTIAQYYKAVGPSPPRLKPPMWRSPDSSPAKGKKRKRDSFEDDEDENVAVEQHKLAISRHRAHWARGETPPGYWNIGFPDTQEVAEMNAEAQRMHERKRALVAVEAEYVFVASLVLCVRADGGSCAGVAGSTGGSSGQGDAASAVPLFFLWTWIYGLCSIMMDMPDSRTCTLSPSHLCCVSRIPLFDFARVPSVGIMLYRIAARGIGLSSLPDASWRNIRRGW